MRQQGKNFPVTVTVPSLLGVAGLRPGAPNSMTLFFFSSKTSNTFAGERGSNVQCSGCPYALKRQEVATKALRN